LDLHFSDFSTIFNEFSKVQLETLTHIYMGTLNFLTELRNSPYIAKNTLDKMQSKQLGPRAGLDLADGGIGGRRRPDLAGGNHPGLLLTLLGREVTLAGPAAASPGAPSGATLHCPR
jgi:hypothetical protein